MKITAYEPKEKMSGRGPLSFHVPGEMRGARRVPPDFGHWRGFMNFAEEVTNIGEKINEAEAVEQYSNAVIETNEQMAKLMERIATDESLAGKSVDEYEKYWNEESVKIREQVNQGIRQQQAKDAYSIKFNEKSVDGLIAIRNFARKRIISSMKASTDEQLDRLTNYIISTGDMKGISEGQAIIIGKTRAGVFSPEESSQLQQGWQRKTVKGYWERKILENPVLAYEMLKQKPESLKFIEQIDITDLMNSAKTKSKQKKEEDERAFTYGQIKAKFGNDNQAAIDYLEDPNNLKKISLESRRYLISTLEAEDRRNYERIQKFRTERSRDERGQIIELMRAGEYKQAVDLTSKSRYIDPNWKAQIYNAAALGKTADVTNPEVYAKIVEGIHAEKITEPEQIDNYRLKGLSNTDADKLNNMIGKDNKLHKDAFALLKAKYMQTYPAKDEFEMHFKWLEFVNFIQDRVEQEEKVKGKSLTDKEVIAIGDDWLKEQVISWWPDEPPKWEQYQKGELEVKEAPRTEGRISDPMRNELNAAGISPENQETIVKILSANGFSLTPGNIKTYWENNREALAAPLVHPSRRWAEE